MKQPDAKKHLVTSIGKSVLRIAGCLLALFSGDIFTLAFLLLLAEFLGVLEELF